MLLVKSLGQWLGEKNPDVTCGDIIFEILSRLFFPFASNYNQESLTAFRATLNNTVNSGGAYSSAVGKFWDVEKISSDPIIYLHTPRGEDSRRLPLVVWAHGGGFVCGEARDGTAIEVFDSLSKLVPVAFASVEYRLAPEHPCPAAIDDVTAAVRYASETLADRFASVSVAGMSAGANLALAAALSYPVDTLVVMYPFLDPHAESASYEKHGYRMNFGNWLKYCWSVYRDKNPVLDRDPAAIQKALSHTHTLILTARADPLHDEGVRLADIVPNSIHVDGRGGHALSHKFDARAASRFFAEWADLLIRRSSR